VSSPFFDALYLLSDVRYLPREGTVMTEPLVITRVTHSCHLIQIGGLTVLTDPWFSQRALYHPGEPIAFQPEQLPHLDAVVISHEHYDHCDLDAFRRYPDKDVPFLVAGPVVEKARKAGFTNVRALEPWQSAQVGDLTIAAVPGKPGVYEVTYVISGGGRSVYFAGDTLLIPELRTLTDRYGPLDVALLPVNGLHIRMAGNKQVVMNAEEAAELTAALRPRLAVPQHYAFTSGTMGDRIFLKSDKTPAHFVEAARRLAPDVPVKVISPGEPLTVAP
jgi:L-ascorbate metabolism protein UlaG (beta-lactamase superfamily)